MKKALFIVGPTSSGKTDLAVKIAQILPSILISADAVQVFRGADIISGKDHPQNVKINLIDVVAPTQNFSISDFLKLSKPLIEEAEVNEKTPIIVGGTGWYASSLYSKIETLNIPPDLTLRERFEALSIEELQEKLKEVNPERFSKMNESDIKNKRRLIRAIEVANSSYDSNSQSLFNSSEILVIGIFTSMEKLRERIEARVENRIEKDAIGEAKKLFKNYDKLSSQVKTANGYKQLFLYLAGEMDFEEAKQRWIEADSQHAKKQMTWFAKDKNIIWFDIEEKGFEDNVYKLIKEYFPRFSF